MVNIEMASVDYNRKIKYHPHFILLKRLKSQLTKEYSFSLFSGLNVSPNSSLKQRYTKPGGGKKQHGSIAGTPPSSSGKQYCDFVFLFSIYVTYSINWATSQVKNWIRRLKLISIGGEYFMGKKKLRRINFSCLDLLILELSSCNNKSRCKCTESALRLTSRRNIFVCLCKRM